MTTTATSPRKTNTQPVCPSWCQVSAEAHEAEAHERIGSWFAHEHDVVVVGDFAKAWATHCQIFEEQMEPGEAPEPIGFFVDVVADSLTAEQALEVADAITRLVKEVKG